MFFDKVIKNGKVVTPDGVIDTDIGIKDGIISELKSNLTDAEEIVDASGMYVMPGVVDAHVHLCEPGRTDWEGFLTGTKALAKGGTTTYVDMPLNNLPATTNKAAMLLKKQSAKGKNYVDYALYGGLIPENEDDLEGLYEEKAAAYKCFVATCGSSEEGDFKNVDDYDLYKGMKKLASLGQVLSIHCENAAICDKLAEEYMKEGKKDMQSYLSSRPIFAEVEAVRRVLYLGKITGCKLHFVHLSCAEAVDEVVKAKKEGMDVTIETCPHYLVLTDEDCVKIGSCAKCSPPIRNKAEQEKLWEKIFDGSVDTIASDHSPCPENMKINKDNDIFKAWGGISACQNVLDVMFDEACKKRNLPVHKLAELLSENPARRFGLKGKGAIKVGNDADIVILNSEKSYVLNEGDMYYKNKMSAYTGRNIGCKVEKTFLRGQLVYDSENGIQGEPQGKFIARCSD